MSRSRTESCGKLGSIVLAGRPVQPLGWGWQDFAAGSGPSLTITDNENGSDIEFSADNIISETAVIVRKDDTDSFAYSGTTRLFSTKIAVSSHTAQNVTLNATPHSSWGDVRVYYLYNYEALPKNYTLAPKFIRDTNIVEIDNLFITEEEFSAYFPISHNNTGQIIDTGLYSHIQIDNHVNSTSNPHTVTAAQVGNDVEQWNADRIRSVNVDDASIADQRVLRYNSTSGNLEYVYLGPGSPEVILDNVTCLSSVYIGSLVKMNGAGVAENAQADSEANANVIGVCESKADSTTCTIRVCGVTGSIFAGLDTTKEYFLSSSVAGGMTTTPPTATGNVVLKIGQPFSSTKMFVLKGIRMVRS